MEQDRILNVAIVGGGPGCKAIMDIIFSEKLSQLRIRLIGVADIDPHAAGYRYAQEKGIYTTQDYGDLFNLKDLDLIVELTGHEGLANEIFRAKPDHVRLMGNVSARLFWDIFRIEEERIAERKEAERVLRDEGRFLRNVFDAIQDGVTVVDCDFNIIRVNPWVERLCASRKPLVGKKCYKAYQIGTSPCPWCPSVRTSRSAERGIGIVAFPSAGNAKRWIELSAFPLANLNGDVIGIIEHLKDITERKQAEQHLRESEAQKRAILDASVDMIRYVDDGMRIIWANRRTSEDLGMAPEDIIGRTCYALFLDRDSPCEGCPTEKVVETGTIEHGVMRKHNFAGRQGDSYWDCYSVPVRDEYSGVARFIQVGRDVTEQKQAEQELERRHRELEAINAVLLRMTKEYSLDGMCRVLQTMMEDFYPDFETWIFLLTPQRDRLYFSRPGEGDPIGPCYEKGRKRLRDLGLEESLLQLLTKEKVFRERAGQLSRRDRRTGFGFFCMDGFARGGGWPMPRTFCAWLVVSG